MFLHWRVTRSEHPPREDIGDKLYSRKTDSIRGAARAARGDGGVAGAPAHQQVARMKTGGWEDARHWTAPPAAARKTPAYQPAKLAKAGAPLRADGAAGRDDEADTPRGRRAISSADRWRWAALASSRWQAWNCIGAAGSSR